MADKIELINSQSPVVPGQLYRSDFEIERPLSPAEQAKLADKFQERAGEDYEINAYGWDGKILSVYFKKIPVLDIATDIENIQLQPQAETTQPGTSWTTPEGFTVIQRGATGSAVRAAVPVVVWYAVSIIATLITTLFFLNYTKRGIYKVIEFTKEAAPKVANFLIPAGILAAIILIITRIK